RMPPQPLPDWATKAEGTASREPVLRYRVPADATFALQDISIAAPRGPLGGSITVPAGQGPSPAVLFISGSGKHDRHGIVGDGDLGSHEIVDYPSNHGMVGLPFSLRGAGT